MSRLLQTIRRTIRRHDLLPSGSSVLIGLSGGSDSVALTFLLRDLARYGDFRLAGLAHFNHRLRDTAARDEDFCRALAERLQLPFVTESGDVRGYAAANRLSPEDAARRLRYDFLARTAGRLGADRIAVGHTQDDQAETFLLKLMRGAGLTGLGGIYPRKDAVVRPLLDVSRAELQEDLRSRGECWVEDETNASLENARSRVRHRVLPELDLAYGGSTRGAIARAAALVREDSQWIDELAARVFEAVVSRTARGAELDVAMLAVEPSPVVRRVVLRALRQVAGEREVGLDHVDAAIAVLRGETAGADLPGARVELQRGKLVLIQQDASSK